MGMGLRNVPRDARANHGLIGSDPLTGPEETLARTEFARELERRDSAPTVDQRRGLLERFKRWFSAGF
jgi:hypothetical protein